MSGRRHYVKVIYVCLLISFLFYMHVIDNNRDLDLTILNYHLYSIFLTVVCGLNMFSSLDITLSHTQKTNMVSLEHITYILLFL